MNTGCRDRLVQLKVPVVFGQSLVDCGPQRHGARDERPLQLEDPLEVILQGASQKLADLRIRPVRPRRKDWARTTLRCSFGFFTRWTCNSPLGSEQEGRFRDRSSLRRVKPTQAGDAPVPRRSLHAPWPPLVAIRFGVTVRSVYMRFAARELALGSVPRMSKTAVTDEVFDGDKNSQVFQDLLRTIEAWKSLLKRL